MSTYVALKRLRLSASLIGYSSDHFLLHLKGFCHSAILLATLQCNYRNKAMRFGIDCTPTIETNVWQIKSPCDYISNYTNYIHIFITCPLFPTEYFFAADLSTG